MGTVYYIGGSPCSGKSTIAELLAKEYGFQYYKLDDFLWPYMEQAAAGGKPNSALQMAMDFEQMWMRNPQLQADEELATYAEILPYALEAIAKLEGGAPILAEGAGFTPQLMAGQGVAKNRYVCIAPTEAFQRALYAKREWIGEYLKGCTDPAAAFDNWMSRDALFAQAVLRQAQALGYSSILVDGKQSIKENHKIVARVFGLEPGA